ncbi:MAG: Ditrans,polycis-undecaprenyl-diphosphate synthase ((2E,6E)-farnesyl-diphosphate specific) [candidate division TA06 bacterium ADurb.Bin417]|uniref:Isoprenyl transferase n=1 Tax=candidate division TA06 bacterium ADurb.Bin417 TaxID=1852828 RepID=A0A1V5M8I6_UNCT6|nr:MAG: Ditrans,polycis-undecaprenyl-diphosphate synthase ((2E,6E)-farnesyl-diphosphate specific) [candidate division TA06 bacterium ADurb.Bin417]
MGHRRGAERLDEVVEACESLGVKYLTIFAFSTENWRRPKPEVSFLLSLLVDQLRRKIEKMKARGVRIRFLGDRAAFNPEIRSVLEESENRTRRNRKVNLSVCLNYGGQDEILRAVRAACADAREGRLNPSELDQDRFSGYLDTRDLPPVDLVIRTSGEQRLSNFLLYQSAYAEFYFTPCLWPDFGLEEFKKALAEFASRQRRFGDTASRSGSPPEKAEKSR